MRNLFYTRRTIADQKKRSETVLAGIAARAILASDRLGTGRAPRFFSDPRISGRIRRHLYELSIRASV